MSKLWAQRGRKTENLNDSIELENLKKQLDTYHFFIKYNQDKLVFARKVLGSIEQNLQTLRSIKTIVVSFSELSRIYDDRNRILQFIQDANSEIEIYTKKAESCQERLKMLNFRLKSDKKTHGKILKFR